MHNYNAEKSETTKKTTTRKGIAKSNIVHKGLYSFTSFYESQILFDKP
jgi:hypothetical protein